MRGLEAEQAVIGSILIDSRCLEAVTRLLRPQDFAAETNREIYQVILAMDRAEQRVDPVTVLEGMKRAGCCGSFAAVCSAGESYVSARIHEQSGFIS